jgi:hypothetical protein
MKRIERKNSLFRDKRWKKLLKVAEMKEKDGKYYPNSKSQGIITYQLSNPKNLTSQGYLKQAVALFYKGDALLSEGKLIQAYEYILVAYLLSFVAGHVDYYSEIRKIKERRGLKLSKHQLAELIRNNNKKLIHLSEQIHEVKSRIVKELIRKGMETDLQEMNKKYNMNFDYGHVDLKIPIRPKTIIRRKIVPIKPIVSDKETQIKALENELADRQYDLKALEASRGNKNEAINAVIESEIKQNKVDIERITKELESLKELILKAA